MRLSKNDQELISEAYSKMLENEAAPQTKLAKIHGENVWLLEPPLKTTRNTYPDSNLVRRGEMKQEPITVEDLFLDRDEKGNVVAIDAEDATRSTVVNLPLPQEFDPKASFEEVLKALGYTVTEKDGQQQLPFKEAKEQTYTIRRTPYTKSARPREERRAIYNATDEELIQQLEIKGESSTADETKQEFNNIAQKCHTLLTGGDAGPEYSGIKINDKERHVITQIAKLILTV